MKKYLDKTQEEKVADDAEFLSSCLKTYGIAKLLDLCTQRHVFINTRALLHRKMLVDAGLTPVSGPDVFG